MRSPAFSALIVVLVSATVALGQEPPPSPQALFDAGRYEDAANAIAAQPEPPPETIFLAGRSYLHLSRMDDARAQFTRLGVGADPATPWSRVGESAIALIDGNAPLAVEKATQAVGLSPDQFHTNYQLGLAQSAAEQWEPAAAAFEKASTLDPSSAYAHYFAGLAYSRLRRIDQMATHLEYFLKLAPNAPERPAVMALMQSVRGR
jgi:tetratricopeptide (TPR) repeat protein